jgi:hypothetical protein
MVSVYEDMANFAAMSEDDGFLGQCAGEAIEASGPDSQLSLLCKPSRPSNWPIQLQLLTIPIRAEESA